MVLCVEQVCQPTHLPCVTFTKDEEFILLEFVKVSEELSEKFVHVLRHPCFIVIMFAEGEACACGLINEDDAGVVVPTVWIERGLHTIV
jgi:hypothetical protein